MNTVLLFRKRSPLTEDGLPWLRGAEEHPWTAKRNLSGKGVVSAILTRALLSALSGCVLNAAASRSAEQVEAAVRSHSAPDSSANCWLDWANNRCGVPHGDERNIVTYHLGVLAIIQALAEPHKALEFWQAYSALQHAFRQYGRSAEIKESLCRAGDELYYWMRYGSADPTAVNCRLEALQIVANWPGSAGAETFAVNTAPLTDPDALRAILGESSAASPEAAPLQAGPETPGGFVGWQADALAEALSNGDRVLLAGPTGTGKTFALHQVVAHSEMLLVTIEGKEGLTDLDFIGAILPQEDGSRRWVDGPLLRAMRMAESDPVLLFIDEANRINRTFLNVLLGLMNPKTGSACRQMGLAVDGDGPFYMIEAPMTSEIVVCPAAHLRIVAAGNFGRLYQVYDLDPAVRRRFDTVIEFDYLDYREELALVQRETPTLAARAAEALVKLAQETRRLLSNGEMPGCVDTASLLNWAKKCERVRTITLAGVMQAAKLTWADTVCGRDHTGRVNQGAFKALEDYLASLAIL